MSSRPRTASTLAALHEDDAYTKEDTTVDLVSTIEVPIVGPSGSRMRFELNPSHSLADQVTAIHNEVGGPDRPANEWTLLAPWRGTFITAELWLEGLPDWLDSGVLKPVLCLGGRPPIGCQAASRCEAVVVY